MASRKKKTSKPAGQASSIRTWIIIAAVLLLCVGAVMAMPAINTAKPDMKTGNFTPFVSDAPTATPVPIAAPVATPTPEITATPEPTPEPTPTPEPVPDTITITAVGDCTLGGDTNSSWGESRFYDYVKKYGYDYFFSGVRDIFENDDLTIVNLEGPLTKQTSKRSGRKFNFRGRPEYVQILTGSSIEICNVANNHALDFKKEGLMDTADTLAKAGIGASGFTVPYYTEVNGRTVCSLGFTEWDVSASKMVSMIREAREKSDLVIVSIHWGQERVYSMPSNCKALGKKLIDAGADIVIGNHSHVVGEIYRYRGKYIIYSLGNFCFGGNKNPDDKNCTIFQQSFAFDADGTVRDAGINIIPAYVSSKTTTNNYCPQVLKGDPGKNLLKKIAKLSNLSADGTVWMENSYVIENNIVAADDPSEADAAMKS